MRAQRYRTLLPWAAVLLLGATSEGVLASDAATIAAQGNGKGMAPCQPCHGADGGGQVAGGFPRLAGLNAAYLRRQLDAFATGTRESPVMKPIASALSAEERQAMAEYFSKLPAPSRPTGAAPAQNATSGAATSVKADAATAASACPAATAAARNATAFTPPPESAIPAGPFGDVVRQGREIFLHTRKNASAYVGNGLNCVNCHLDAGRLANSAPLWGAYVMYPQYRSKNKHVNSYGERLQGCFRFSMNGKVPPLDSKEMVALETYSYWMASGAPVGVKLPGAGYPKKGFKPPQPPDYARGEKVFGASCALCHGADGQGQKEAGEYVFPPLWGPDSFNWGAGMHQLDNAAAFIKANMPLSRGGSLSDQDAWDVAMFMDAHERPQDPRYKGNLAQTRKQYHNTPMSLYGTEVNGHLLGSAPATTK